MKRFWMFALFLAGALVALNAPAFAADTDTMEDVNAAIGNLSSKVNALEKKGLNVEIHGFVQSDIINDDTESFNETVGNGGVKAAGSVAGDNGWTQFSLRNSRFDFLATGAEIGGWKTKGYIEFDLLGYDQEGYGATTAGTNNLATDNSEYKFYTQPTLRLRHAYLDAQNDGWEIVAGQWWSLFGWNMDYVLATVTEAPVMGTLYERIPQLRVQKNIDFPGMQLQVAVDAEKPDQAISSMPNFNGGIRLMVNDIKGYFCSSTGASKLMPLSLGLSERNSQIVWPTGTASNDVILNQSMWGSAVAADAMIPVLPAAEGKDDPSVVLVGEWSAGAGDTLSFNGGGFGGLTGLLSTPNISGQGSGALDAGIVGIDAKGNYGLVQLQSLTAQIMITLPRSIGTIVTAGYGELYSPNIGGLNNNFTITNNGTKIVAAGTVFNDDTCMFANVMQDMTSNIRVGLEYARFDTHYLATSQDAVDHRIQLSTWYRF